VISRHVAGRADLKQDVQRSARAVRAYWQIENGTHGVLDVAFGEGLSPMRAGRSAAHFNWGDLTRRARRIKAERLRAARSGDFPPMGPRTP